MARDLKLTAVLVDKVSAGLAKASQDWRKAVEEPAKAAVKAQESANKRIIDSDEKLNRERIRLQRASIVLMEKQSQQAASVSMRAGENTLRASKSQADAALKIQRQAAIAESALVLNKFDRQIAKERQIHAFRLSDLKGNDAAIEAEVRRHNAVVGRMSMDKANFPNTPFQTLLGHLSRVTGQMGIQLPAAIQTATANMKNAQTGSASLGIVLAGTGAAFLAMGAASVYAYTQAREQADADKRLQAILKSTGNAAGVSMGQLQDMAGAYQELTDFSDDAVQGAEAVLLRFNGIGKDIFPQALKATVDLASVTGNLSGAASDLGQALEKPEDAARKLKGMDILLTDSQKKLLQQLVDTGDKAKAQKFILDAVAKSYGGNAESMAHATTKLGHRISELAERMGMHLLPVVDFAADALTDLITPDAMQKPKAYWDAQKLGALGFTLSAQDAADAMAKLKTKTEPEKVLSDDQKEKIKTMTDELQKAKLDSMQDGALKAIAIEALEHKLRLEKLGSFNQAIALENQTYAAKVQAIRMSENTKAREAADSARNDELASQREHNAKIREASKREQDEAVKADEQRTAQKYAASDSLKMAKTNDPIEQLRLRQEAELSLVTDHQAQIDTKERQGLELKRAIAEQEAQIYSAKSGYVSQYAASVSDMVGIIGGKSKAAFAIQKGIALGEIAVRTASAVVTDNANPLTWWKVPYDIALGATQAAVVAGTAIKGFESGGWTGSGGRSDVAGVVHGGEMVWSQDDVRRAGGRQAAESIRQGGATTVSAPISIVIHGNADERAVKAIGETLAQKLRNHAWLTAEVKNRRITA